MIRWPEQLISDIARRRVVIFIGSGVSRNSVGENHKRPPLWIEFLELGLAQCDDASVKKEIKALIKKSDLLTACELIKRQLGNHWDELLNNEFVIPHYQHAKIHETIFKLDSRIVLTQNFDKIYDTYSAAQSQGTISVKNYYDPDIPKAIRGNRRLVIKVHGTIDSPPQMVFTKGEYGSARHRYAGFHCVLDSLLLTHTFLFLGCSLADPDIQMMLERYAHIHEYANPHFVVTPEKIHPILSETIKRNMNLEMLPYSAANDHQELASSLETLSAKVDSKRQEIVKTLDW